MSSLWSSLQQYFPVAVFVVLPTVGAVIIGELIANRPHNYDWYNKTLKKPSYTPPYWMFPPVWTVIYTCMGISSYLIFEQGGFAAPLPVILYGTQLLLNWIWPLILLRYRRTGLVSAYADAYYILTA